MNLEPVERLCSSKRATRVAKAKTAAESASRIKGGKFHTKHVERMPPEKCMKAELPEEESVVGYVEEAG